MIDATTQIVNLCTQNSDDTLILDSNTSNSTGSLTSPNAQYIATPSISLNLLNASEKANSKENNCNDSVDENENRVEQFSRNTPKIKLALSNC